MRLAFPQRGQCQGAQSGPWWKRQRFASLCGEQGACQGQQFFAEAVGEQAIAADAHEASWQYMQEKAAEEVHGVEVMTRCLPPWA
jgi:hypothetical protein